MACGRVYMTVDGEHYAYCKHCADVAFRSHAGQGVVICHRDVHACDRAGTCQIVAGG